MKKPTLHDVATAAGVSTRTVSRVVNGESGMSEATRERIRAAIKDVGYLPNLAARSLVTRKTKTIGLVVGELTDPFFPELADGVMRAARRRDHTILLSATSDDANLQTEILERMASQGVDAVIIFPVFGTEPILRDLAEGGLAIVVVDAEAPAPTIASVASDIRAGAALATAHLLERGHRRVGMLSNVRSHSRWREGAFVSTLEAAGLDSSLIARAAPTLEGGRRAADELISKHPSTTAVFAYNDVMAIGALQYLQGSGRIVPGDVAVVGFDDIPMTELITPPLSTVRLDRERVGVEAVRMAVALASDGAVPDPVAIPVELVVRHTT